jgi:hypothetical protein
MDDLVVEFDEVGRKRVVSLQIKRSVTISSSASNTEFRGIITAAVKTQALGGFTKVPISAALSWSTSDPTPFGALRG